MCFATCMWQRSAPPATAGRADRFLCWASARVSRHCFGQKTPTGATSAGTANPAGGAGGSLGAAAGGGAAPQRAVLWGWAGHPAVLIRCAHQTSAPSMALHLQDLPCRAVSLIYAAELCKYFYKAASPVFCNSHTRTWKFKTKSFLNPPTP